jgi:hypothetical protein
VTTLGFVGENLLLRPLYHMTSETRDHSASPSGSSKDGDVLDLADDEGWEDLEPDVEAVRVLCLMCSMSFDGVKPMLEHCKEIHDMVIAQVQKDLR